MQSPRKVESLGAGEVGLVIAGIKSLEDVQIGDTLTDAAGPAAEAAAFCHSCGDKLPAGARFCPGCGTEVAE